MKYELTTPRIVPPVSLDDVKRHLVVEHANDDNLLTAYISQASDWTEQYTGKQLGNQVWTVYGDCWADITSIAFKPITSVVITYDDEDGVEQTLAADQYYLDDKAYPATICPATDVTWPDLDTGPNVIRVTVTCGYTSAPSAMEAAINMLVGDMYMNRENSNMTQMYEVPLGVKAFLDQVRVAF